VLLIWKDCVLGHSFLTLLDFTYPKNDIHRALEFVKLLIQKGI